jgi:single-strand DNA-binding protein
LFIEGRISTTSYIDDQRIKRYNLDIVANKVDVLGMVDVSQIKS